MHAEIKATSELSLIILQLNFRMDRKVLFNIISVHELLYLRQTLKCKKFMEVLIL